MKFNSLFVAAAVCLLLTACGKKQEKAAETPIGVSVETVGDASNGNLSKTYIGQVEGESSTSVSFTSSGMITRVMVDEGQHVSKGQLIAELDKTQAQNMVTTATAQMKQANDALARMKQLHDSKSLPDIKWVEVQTQVEEAQTQLAAAKKMLTDCELYAPVSGIVSSKQKNTGETALPSMPVVTITNIGNVKVKVNIPEKEISSIKSGTPSRITVDALSGKTYRGGSIDKGIQGDAVTHSYDVKINVNNSGEQLLPGMVCKVQFANGQTISGITVPIRCVQQSASGEQFVWVVQNGKAHRQNVSLGETSGNRIVVTSGLSVGVQVITSGYQKVSEGTVVKVQ